MSHRAERRRRVVEMRAALAAVVLALAAIGFASATVMHGREWSATYVAAYNPLFSGGVPFSGEMKLQFRDGIVSGTFTGTSVRPDPLNGRIVPVNGTVSHGRISLTVGGSSGFEITNGTIDAEGTISGTAVRRGQMYRFLAKVKSSP